MQTLTYGFLLPEDGDKGSVFFPALETDIQQLNDHDHNGTNSKKLTSSSVSSTTVAVASGSWAVEGSGYSQTVAMPAGLLVDDYFLNFKITSSGAQLLPTVEKASSSSFKVYVNDNTLDLLAYLTS